MLVTCKINNYQLEKQLGSGAYGLVFYAVDLKTGHKYAIKAVLNQNNAGVNWSDPSSNVKQSTLLQTQLYYYFKSFQNKLYLPSIDLETIKNLNKEQLCSMPHYKEVSLQLKVHSHQNVVSIHEVLKSPIAIFIVMDYYSRDLFTTIVEDQYFVNDGILIKKVFLQICSAIHYCHEQGIFHCDIKPENILLDEDDNIYLCDFGLSTTSSEELVNVCIGSSYYMAPEKISCPYNISYDQTNLKAPTSASDIWSLGIILINLVCIRNPWLKAHQTQDNTFHQFTKYPIILKKILPISTDLYYILLGIFQLNPWERVCLSRLMIQIAQCPSFTTSGPLHSVKPLTDFRYVEGLIEDNCANNIQKDQHYHTNEYFIDKLGTGLDDYDTEYLTFDGDIFSCSSLDTSEDASPDRTLPSNYKQNFNNGFTYSYLNLA